VVGDGQSGVRVDTNRGNLTSGTTSKHVVHIDQMGKRFSVVVDGKASAECDDFFGPVFSPDGKRVALAYAKWPLVSGVGRKFGRGIGAISSLFSALTAREWHMQPEPARVG